MFQEEFIRVINEVALLVLVVPKPSRVIEKLVHTKLCTFNSAKARFVDYLTLDKFEHVINPSHQVKFLLLQHGVQFPRIRQISGFEFRQMCYLSRKAANTS